MLSGHQLTLMVRAKGYTAIGAPASGSCSCGAFAHTGAIEQIREAFAEHVYAVWPKRGADGATEMAR